METTAMEKNTKTASAEHNVSAHDLSELAAIASRAKHTIYEAIEREMCTMNAWQRQNPQPI
jgi:hypothetical protein